MTEFKVGLFTLATLAAIILMSFKITSRQAAFGTYVTYKTILRDATGIFEKSPIKVAGINAGRIKKIQLHNERALVTFEVLNSVKVTEGSKLQTKMLGLLGEKYVDILLNRKSNVRLLEDSIIPSLESGGLETVTKDLSDILQNIKTVVQNVEQSISPENEGDEPPLRTIIHNLKSITENLAYEFDGNNKDSLVYGIRKSTPIFDDLKTTSNDLKSIMANIRKGKGTLGKLLHDEEIVDQVTETLAGVKKIVNKVDSIKTELQVFTAANSKEKNITELGIDIYPSTERFYRLGVVTSEFGAEKIKEVKTVINGGPATLIETTEREKNSYRFNLMMGRKINNWTLRFGVLESSGGVGVDYKISRYNLNLKLDLFDYREDIGPHFRLGTDMHLWNIFYGRITGDDLFNEEQRGLSLGAGFKFTDEDLKGLISFFL